MSNNLINKQEEYQGWANYETWNVALWITSEVGFYEIAKECKGAADPYGNFLSRIKELEGVSTLYFGYAALPYQTRDGVAWNDSGLNQEELNECINNL